MAWSCSTTRAGSCSSTAPPSGSPGSRATACSAASSSISSPASSARRSATPWRACSPGVNVDAFDLQLSTTSGSPVWVSASTSTVLAGTGAVILAFRDVTAERALEHELRSTKEFLERLIDSTVDAIIAADMRGQIILFNQGAERLFGYRARDVIGKLPVWELYEEGGAQPDHADAALDLVRRRRPPRADPPRGPDRERRDRARSA